jgi:hypothetical protein
VIVCNQPGCQLTLLGGIAEQLEIIEGGLEPVIRPDLGIELAELRAERLRFRKAPEPPMVVKAMRGNGLGLFSRYSASILRYAPSLSCTRSLARRSYRLRWKVCAQLKARCTSQIMRTSVGAICSSSGDTGGELKMKSSTSRRACSTRCWSWVRSSVSARWAWPKSMPLNSRKSIGSSRDKAQFQDPRGCHLLSRVTHSPLLGKVVPRKTRTIINNTNAMRERFILIPRYTCKRRLIAALLLRVMPAQTRSAHFHSPRGPGATSDG